MVFVSENVFQHLGGFKIFFSNGTVEESHTVFVDDSKNASNTYNISLPNIITRIIEVQRPGVLTICEILVLRGGKPVLENCIGTDYNDFNVLHCIRILSRKKW